MSKRAIVTFCMYSDYVLTSLDTGNGTFEGIAAQQPVGAPPPVNYGTTV